MPKANASANARRGLLVKIQQMSPVFGSSSSSLPPPVIASGNEAIPRKVRNAKGIAASLRSSQ